ncbi:hypothetical protein T484DRAFT_1897293, partial [Baffinella frigidus]
MAGADGGGGGDNRARQEAEEEARAAVANIFEVLCGQSDASDKFTGLQREMDERIRLVVFRAVEIGKESGVRQLTREEFRWKKQVGELKQQAKEATRRAVEAARVRVEAMCSEMKEQQSQLRQNLTDFEAAQRSWGTKTETFEKAASEGAGREAGLTKSLTESRAEAAALRSKVAVLQESLDQAMSGEREKGDLQRRWSDDVGRMEGQLQDEVSRRVAAEERERLAKETLNDMETLLEGEREAAAEREDATGERKVEALQKEVHRLETMVREMQGERMEQHKRSTNLFNSHAQQLAQAMDEIGVERDARAVVEVKCKRLEHELNLRARAVINSQQRGPAKSGVRKTPRANEIVFKDFSADLERALGSEAKLQK